MSRKDSESCPLNSDGETKKNSGYDSGDPAASHSCPSEAFRELLDYVGASGKYQWRIFFVGSFCGFFFAFNSLSAARSSWPVHTLEDFTNDVINPDSRPIRDVTSIKSYDVRTNCSSAEEIQPVNRVDTKARVKLLREKMVENSLDALLIPSADEHQNEFVSPSDQRREFATGFSGSAGLAVVTSGQQVISGQQVLWTDTRYTLQADQQVDCDWKVVTTGSPYAVKPTKWLTDELQNGAQVGADTRLFGASEWEDMAAELAAFNISMVDSKDLVDDVWTAFGKPSRNETAIFAHQVRFAGLPWKEKTSLMREYMLEEGVDLLVVSLLDDVAWLLNLRGGDNPYNPVFRSYVVIEGGSDPLIHLFLAGGDEHLSEEVRQHLDLRNCTSGTLCVKVHPYASIWSFLQEKSQKDEVQHVCLSADHAYSKGASYYIYSAVPAEKRKLAPSPVMLRKSRKTGAEGAAMVEAQVKDSVALVEFFAFLEDQMESGASEWDELSVLPRLRAFRGQQAHFRGPSFEAISAFGPNAALAHYTPSEATKRAINNQSLYLLDSGGQYLDGTTDVTRTFHYGAPTALQREAYTRVLQGAIDLASLVLPKGTRDVFLDIVARRPLLESGLTYGHGTGHGIGLYLAIHEGPTLISMSTKRSSEIEVGQFFSDEPGYYKANDFGIRLENILRVLPHPTFEDAWGSGMMLMEVVTLVPFEPKLIDATLLTRKQCGFLNAYNARIRRVVGGRLVAKGSEAAHEWMRRKTSPLECSASPPPISTGKGHANSGSSASLLALCLVSWAYRPLQLV